MPPVQSPPTSSSNTISVDVRVLAIFVTVLLACFGYIALLVGSLNEVKKSNSDLVVWQKAHEKEFEDYKRATGEELKDIKASFQLQWTEQKQMNKEQQQTLTNIQIAVGAPSARR